MFKTIFASLTLLHLTLAAPTSDILPRDDTGSVVTAPNALAWYSSSLTTGTSGLTDPSSYTCYTGPATNFPAMSTWVAFGTMWNQSLQYTFAFEPNTKAQTQDIYNSIVSVSKLAKVDARVILATILLESSGNLSVACSTSPVGQIPNCGLMQSYNGSSFNSAAPVKSITQMIVDGTQGTPYGPGLVQLFNDASNTPKLSNGNAYIVFREYNSGTANLTDLGIANGANPAYVSNMANYLQGWNGYGNATQINQKCGFKAPPTPTPTPAPTCAAKNYVAPPTATVSGTTPNCCKWVVPVAGDSCYSIDQANGITLAQFQSWNTYIDAACDNLWAGTAYCVNGVVAAAGGSSSSSSIPAAPTTSVTSSKTTSTKPTTTKTSSTKTRSTTSKTATTTTSKASSTTKVVKKTRTPTAAAQSSSSKKRKTKTKTKVATAATTTSAT